MRMVVYVEQYLLSQTREPKTTDQFPSHVLRYRRRQRDLQGAFSGNAENAEKVKGFWGKAEILRC
jgi:hypothetical protein